MNKIRLRALSLLPVTALTLLAACGGGGGGGSSSAYHLPYETWADGNNTLHLVNASTLASSKRSVEKADAYVPWQLLPNDDSWRLVALPPSHVFFYDSEGRTYRQALKGGSTAFAFPAGCEISSWSFGDEMPSIPWAIANCGSNRLKLLNLMATTGDGIISEADFSGLNDIELLSGTWDTNGLSGFIAAQQQVAGEYELYRYSSSDWAHPQRLGSASAAKGFNRLGLGSLPSTTQHIGARDPLWLEADNGFAGKTWYKASTSGRFIVLAALPDTDLTGASQFQTQSDALYYTKTVGGVPAIYKLWGVFAETKLVDATAGSIDLLGFTPTRVLWQDGSNLKSSLLDGSGDTKTMVTSDVGAVESLFVKNENVFFSHHGFAYRMNSSNPGALDSLGVAKLFRADFAGVNSGTALDDGHFYLANTDGAGTVSISAATLSDPTNPLSLGSTSGYTTTSCTAARLALRIAFSPKPDGNQLMTLDCQKYIGDGGVFLLKPDQANSLKPLQAVAPHSNRIQSLLPAEAS